ncbi:glycosyltransferase family 2 protein [Chondrinema litorale]|uniref:glycosyltransferase family 2 protein n=1 Tax=Chondrinema litorale TaxID=2994555 RepID=UPI00254285CF|nr:glycosyltransferase family 2 protein [Chondrinema litorale]UZR94406.1 glycosyltransferase family 2 protein [Chondrinema litorale]
MFEIFVIIPAFNEEKSIKNVINDIPEELVKEIVVVDNNSTDNTPNEVLKTQAILLKETRKGYGSACLKGIEYLKQKITDIENSIIVFLDGDYSDYPEQMEFVVAPIIDHQVDMVIGSRALGKKDKGSMTPQQIFGNWLATYLMKIIYGAKFTDLGPFRAIRFDALLALNMIDTNYGWTVEMQLKAAKNKLRFCEVPVDYRKRIGVSKVSGTVKGTIGAGYKILYTIFRYM